MTAFTKETATSSASPSDGESQKWNALLQRSTPHSAVAERGRDLAGLAGKRVLVTGAGGWIGSALARAIAQSDASELVLLDAAEGALHVISQALLELNATTTLQAVLASVCDSGAIANLFDRHRPEIVFHAGAFKHVPLMESNPFAVVANNALGTHTLAEIASKFGCEQMVMVSTDKAVDPLSLMGASKRIAELVMLAPRTGSMRKQAVRLGNVLGSSGSVVPLFLRQIAHGGPVTVSHPDVRRYFMTTTETVETLLHALSANCPDGLLVPRLGAPIRIFDLAHYLIAQNSSGPNGPTPEERVPIVFTSLRPGDKMEESLISARETYAGEQDGLLRAVNSPALTTAELTAGMEQLRQAQLEHNLDHLIQSVLQMVPEYQPSLLICEQIHAAAGAAVGV